MEPELCRATGISPSIISEGAVPASVRVSQGACRQAIAVFQSRHECAGYEVSFDRTV